MLYCCVPRMSLIRTQGTKMRSLGKRILNLEGCLWNKKYTKERNWRLGFIKSLHTQLCSLRGCIRCICERKIKVFVKLNWGIITNHIMHVSLILVSPCSSSVLFRQGIAGDASPLAQDYFVWANTELGNFMTYNSYTNEDTKILCS